MVLLIFNLITQREIEYLNHPELMELDYNVKEIQEAGCRPMVFSRIMGLILEGLVDLVIIQARFTTILEHPIPLQPRCFYLPEMLALAPRHLLRIFQSKAMVYFPEISLVQISQRREQSQHLLLPSVPLT